MSEQPTVTVSEPIPDPRPEPGPMPDMWVVRWWEWKEPSSLRVRAGWEARVSMFPRHSHNDAEDDAIKVSRLGARRVQVVKIAGDAE